MADFFEQGLARLGAICERTWHDRLELLAEGAAARLWSAGEELQALELHFPETAGPLHAAIDIFPGCPLTFRLAEILWQQLPNECKIAIAGPSEGQHAPAAEVAHKTWHQQHPQKARASFGPFCKTWHFTLVASLRCEVQAIEQHWSAHRIALAWPGGERDAWLEHNLEQIDPLPMPLSGPPPAWPAAAPEVIRPLLEHLLLEDLASELTSITARQQRYLARELTRIDAYFADYARELRQRARRRASTASGPRYEQRLEAAAAEHARRREDQLRRHEITIAPHLDALLWLAEPAWESRLAWRDGRAAQSRTAVYLPRLRRWFLLDQ